MQKSPVVFFAQKLASNSKQIRDTAIRKLKKWITTRASSTTTEFTEDDIMKIWKGLFYCMWMSDKSVVQEELARTISELIYCFGEANCSLLFIKGFFATMIREWSNLDYLRVDKYMMLVRIFLNQSLEFIRKLKWEEKATNQLIDILDGSVINPKMEDTPMGLQMHVADIYVEELAKVASSELSAKKLTLFFLPYCRLLAENKNSALRWTVIHHVFEFTMRLCDSDFDSEGEPGVDMEDKDQNGYMEDSDPESDEGDNLSKVYGEYKGEDRFLNQVRFHEKESMKLPFPNFDYKHMGDTLLELVGKSTGNIKQKLRNQTYRLVKRFHEMASGIFPLDGVNPSIGRRMRSSDYDAAAMRLLQLDEEIAEEKRLWQLEVGKEHGRKLGATSIDPDGVENEGYLPIEDEDGQKHKKLRLKEHTSGGFLQLGKCRNDNKVPLNILKKAAQKVHDSKKRCLPDDTSDIITSMNANATKKAKNIAPNANPMVCLKAIPYDKLAKTLVLTEDSPMMKTGTSLDPKTRKTAVKRSKRKSRVMRQKLAKLERKAKSIEKVKLNNACANEVLTKKVLKTDAIRNIPKSLEMHVGLPIFAASDPLLSVQVIQTAELDLLSNTKKISFIPVLAKSSDDIKAHDKINATMRVSNKLKEKQSVQKDLAVNEDKIISKEKFKIPSLKKLKIPASQQSPGITDVDLQTLPRTLSLKSQNTISQVYDKNSVEAEEVSIPISTVENIVASPTTKRKVDFVTLWTPSEKTSVTNSRVPGLRRSTRSAKSTFLVKQPALTGKRLPLSTKRYYDEVAARDINQSENVVSNKSDSTSDVKSVNSGKSIPMVQFEAFIKTPPAFFRTAVKKITPQKTPTSTKDTPLDESKLVTKSAKKVNFSLAKNSSQGLKHYAMSLRSRPGIPFNADKVPVQGVLKVSHLVKHEPMSKKRRLVK